MGENHQLLCVWPLSQIRWLTSAKWNQIKKGPHGHSYTLKLCCTDSPPPVPCAVLFDKHPLHLPACFPLLEGHTDQILPPSKLHTSNHIPCKAFNDLVSWILTDILEHSDVWRKEMFSFFLHNKPRHKDIQEYHNQITEKKRFLGQSLQAQLWKQVMFCTKAQHTFWKSWLLGNLDNSLCKIRLRTSVSKWELAAWHLQLNHSSGFWRVYSEHKDSAMLNMREPEDSTSCKHRMGEHRLSRYRAYKQLLLELWYHTATDNSMIPYGPLLCHFSLLPPNAPLAVCGSLLENCSVHLKY